jgi:hypothetical protein
MCTSMSTSCSDSKRRTSNYDPWEWDEGPIAIDLKADFPHDGELLGWYSAVWHRSNVALPVCGHAAGEVR